MSIWSTLGLEPTTDLIAVKRAYAARLKVTRPDEDPRGYQILREAYEAAQGYARGAAPLPAAHMDEPPVAPTTAPAATPGAAETQEAHARHEPTAPPAAEPEPEPPPLAYIPAHALAEQTLHHLQQAGPDALNADWPLLERELDNLPLWERTEASRWFAQLVIDTEQMPRLFARALSSYFAWDTDFRTDEVLGKPRAIALRQRLHDLNYGFHADAAFSQRYAEVSFVGRMVEQLSKWRFYLLAVLSSSRLARLWDELEPRQRYVLGVPPPLHSRAERAMEVGGWVRTLAVVLLAATLVQLKGYAERPWLERVALAVANGVVGWVVLHFAYRFFLSFKSGVQRMLRPEGLAPGLPRRSHLAAAGFACMLLATLMCGLSEADAWPAAYRAGFGSPLLVAITLLLIAFAVMTPSLPPTEASPAFPAILILCVVTGVHLPWFAGLPWTGACAGMTWFMAACIAYTLHHEAIEGWWQRYKATAQQQRLRANAVTVHGMLVFLLSVLRVTVAWPYRLMLLGTAQSARFAIAIACISIVALPAQHRAWQVPFSAAVAGLFVLFSGFCFNHALLALVPGQDTARKGWFGLALLALWVVWAGVYLNLGASIDAHVGWKPAVHEFDIQLRRFCLVLLVPFVLTMWTYRLFNPDKTGQR